jgi:hypothetical protein
MKEASDEGLENLAADYLSALREAVPNLGFKVGEIEEVKITLQFPALGLLMTPAFLEFGGIGQHEIQG